MIKYKRAYPTVRDILIETIVIMLTVRLWFEFNNYYQVIISVIIFLVTFSIARDYVIISPSLRESGEKEVVTEGGE